MFAPFQQTELKILFSLFFIVQFDTLTEVGVRARNRSWHSKVPVRPTR